MDEVCNCDFCEERCYIILDPNLYQELEKNKYCINCGLKGHIIKNCPEPITSFGIIAYKISYKENENDKSSEITKKLETIGKLNKKYPVIKYLMIQRKNTMGYIDFIRGKYDEQTKDKLLDVYINEMTAKEKNCLKTSSFDELWDDLWNSQGSKGYLNEYKIAKKKFEMLNLKKLLPTIDSEYDLNELSFPKGRKNPRESNIECAEREFCEETGYNKSDYKMIRNHHPIEEIFTGTNDKQYKHVYYLVKFNSTIHDPIYDENNKNQSSEVKNINWLTYEEASSLIRPYDTEKKKILDKIDKEIRDYININTAKKCDLESWWKQKVVKIDQVINKYEEIGNYLVDTNELSLK